MKLVEDNPDLTMVQGMGTPAMKYERSNLLVLDHEYKNLTTYMRQLHEYYMA